MATELGTVRVKPLLSVLEGSDPVEYVLKLLTESSNSLLYVRIPDGFRCDYWKQLSIGSKPCAPEQMPKAQPGNRAVRNALYPSYMRLDREQIQALVASGIVTLDTFNAGGLFLRLKENQALSVEFDSQFMILSAKLEPESRDIGYATPTAFDPAKGHCMVVKSFDRRSKENSYELHGVSLKDLFIGTESPVESLKTSVDTAEPWDPYSLKESSPLVYAILKKAFENRGKKRSEINQEQLAADFWSLNEHFAQRVPAIKNPFKDKRHGHARNLANPTYKYDGRKGYEIEATIDVPTNEFLDQDFINDKFRGVLYAACRWSGAMKPALDESQKSLMKLLIGLRSGDYTSTSAAPSFVFFITGKRYKRDVRDGFEHEKL